MQRSASSDDRVMLVTTVKDEGPNILEWIAYHRMIGFTDIVVFQNDSFDTTERSLWTLQEMGVIRYLNNDFRRPGRNTFQNRAYRRAARLPEYGQARWCMALDGDEFLRVNVGQGRVQDLVGAVADADEVRLNWRIFGNSHLRRLDGRMVTERFTMANEITLPSRHPMPVKTLFKTDSFQLPGIHMPKRPVAEDRIIRNGSGTLIDQVLVRGFQVTDPQPYALAQVNHYMVKDSDSFLMKSARGSSSHPDRAIALDYWKKRNVNREEDRTLASLAEAIGDEVRSLDTRSGGLLGRLRSRSLWAWRRRIADIKVQPVMRGLWEQLV
ncbi:MAG: glycosyltransferase family 2 protein [Paracoccaceae bacterium]